MNTIDYIYLSYDYIGKVQVRWFLAEKKNIVNNIAKWAAYF